MPSAALTFPVTRYCNYKVRIDSAPGNEIVLYVVEDPMFDERLVVTESSVIFFHYFNGDLDEITFEIDSLSRIELTLTREDIGIDQLYVAEHMLPTLYEPLKSRTGLKDYYNDDRPAIYYGIVSDNDLDALRRNRSLKVVIWTGGDINAAGYREESVRERVLRNIAAIRRLSKVVHISRSVFVDRSLKDAGFQSLRLPFCPTELDLYKPVPKGDCIYVYTAPSLDWYYGSDLYDRVVERYKDIEFIFTCCKPAHDFMVSSGYIPKHDVRYYEREELISHVYPRCFLALRLTVHDGFANTVQELGLIGIKSVHNGDGPSCLNYTTLDDICRHIDTERAMIGTCDMKLASEMRAYLTLDPAFFSTGYFSRLVAEKENAAA